MNTNPSEEDPGIVARRLAAIIDSSDDAIVGKDLESIVTSWNAGAERLFGYSAKEMIGSSIRKIIPEEKKSEEDDILAKLRSGQRIDHFETVRVHKSGKRIHVSITISPIRDSSGAIIGASKIARDVTERKMAEEALKRAAEERAGLLERERTARAEVERVSRMKDEFLATVSHELRTPLNAILGWTSLLKDSLSEEDVRRGIDVIDRNARAQTQIINDLLDMSRIISGKMRLEVQRVDLPAILQQSVETIRNAVEAKGLGLHVVMDSLNGTVAGDPNRLQQVFWNLLNNSVKFTPKGGRIQVLLERVNSHVEISIIDSGEGIDPAFLPYVFNRFEQADASAARRHGGLGIGLAIVKQLVELHGGTVRAKSPGLGLGATFVVYLPVTPLRELNEPGPVPFSKSAEEYPVVSLLGARVLVVDDEPDAREIIKRLLESAGATVKAAGSTMDAYEVLNADEFDVLVCDIGMPGEDGYSFIGRVRTMADMAKREIAAIALTAYARAEDRTQAIRAGFQYHLSKPVDPAELLTVVRSLSRPRSST